MPESEVDWYTGNVMTQPNRRYYVEEVEGTIVGKIDVSLYQSCGFHETGGYDYYCVPLH